MADTIRVGVLFGGQSGEHEVSLVSAQAVMAGLDRAKYEVLPIGITKEGQWICGPDPLGALAAMAEPHKLPTGFDANSRRDNALDETVAALTITEGAYSTHEPLAILRQEQRVDVVFPVLHGPMGEDGTVQGLLELAGVPYVGCGVLASAVGMDKAMMKAAFAAAGLPLLPWLLIRRHEWQRAPEPVYAWIESQLRYPLFVKPANMGSSVGITKAADRASLERGMAEAAIYDRRIVVEQGVSAREIEVSVLGNDTPEASVPGEVLPANEWYDYDAKYRSGDSQIVIPAQVSPEIAAQAREMAVEAFRAVDAAGLARVDFLLDRDSGALFINEVNTMPGFTPVSMYAKMWEASGLPYTALLDRLIELALERGRG
jgi:D-alanine-D-alanine ligase